MKKTLLATAIAGALGVTAAAQAATVYDQDGTKVDIYGRIAMGIAGGGPDTVNGADVSNDPQFVDAFSRLGLRLQHMVSSDLTAFGHLEWRFNADGGGQPANNEGRANSGRFSGFKETRQSYLGLRSNTWGTIQAGNFDSFYKDAVTAPFDVYIDQGLEFQGHPFQSRGDSIGYFTPDLNGFQVFLQGKHYSDRGLNEAVINDTNESEIAFQGGVKYEIGGLRLAVGAVDDVQQGGGNDEMLYGATVAYQFTPEFSARLGYETQDHNANVPVDMASRANGHDSWGIGLTYAVNQWAFNLDYYNIEEEDNAGETHDRDAWAAGAYYNISSNFDVFLELYDSDTDISGDTSVNDFKDDVYYLVGARYFF